MLVRAKGSSHSSQYTVAVSDLGKNMERVKKDAIIITEVNSFFVHFDDLLF